MTPSNNHRSTSWIALLVAIAITWLPVVLFVWLSSDPKTASKASGTALAGAAVVVATYAFSRKQAWSLILWIPLILTAALGSLFLLGTGLSTPTSGPSAGPLEGVAVLLMLVIAVGLCAFVFASAWFRPKSWSTTILVIGLLNSALIFMTGSSGFRIATGQEIMLRLSDPAGKPVAGAEVRFERFRYGHGGAESFEASGGPFRSDSEGVARVPSRRMRYKTRMTVHKEGFREITVTLHMQLAEHDRMRAYTVSTYETPAIATGTVLATDTPVIPISLSPLSDAPTSKVVRFSLFSKHDLQETITPKSLELKTGKFADDLSGDIELEYFSASMTRYRDQKLRLRGLNGVQLFLASHNERFPTATHTLYEQLYQIAPQSGYEHEVIIDNPGNSPGPVVYVRALDGKLHGRLCIEVLGNGVDETPRYSGTLVINPSGRMLEWGKQSD
jgi:hypothetical protein